jgi:hypothetical protein
VFYTQRDLDDDFTFGGWPDQYDIRTVLSHAWAATVVFGFVPTSAYTGVPTKYIMDDLLNGRTNSFTTEELDKVRSIVDTADTEVDAIIEFINSDEFGGSNYANNLKTLINNDGVDPKHYGLLASAPNALNRHREQQVQRQVEQDERDQYSNEWIGNAKDRLELTVTVKAIRYIDGQFGTTALYTMLTDTNHVVKWFASGKGLGRAVNTEREGFLGYDGDGNSLYGPYTQTEWVEATEGDVFRIKGTVKGHDEWQGVKQTVLTRVVGDPVATVTV